VGVGLNNFLGRSAEHDAFSSDVEQIVVFFGPTESLDMCKSLAAALSDHPEIELRRWVGELSDDLLLALTKDLAEASIVILAEELSADSHCVLGFAIAKHTHVIVEAVANREQVSVFDHSPLVERLPIGEMGARIVKLFTVEQEFIVNSKAK
jgi:hypothetical protein